MAVSNIAPLSTSGPRDVVQALVKPTGYLTKNGWFRLYDFHLKAGSVAIANGTSSCVSGGKSPCVPKFDIVATIRLSNPSLGAYEDSSGEASAPAAPTGLTAQVQ